ncbi:MAG: GC-type dockerin domain-anchored protein [Planctomycetota bacterium]
MRKTVRVPSMGSIAILSASAIAGGDVTISAVPDVAGLFGEPADISDSGVVVGTYSPFTGGSPKRGFVWTPGGALTTLEPIQDSTPVNVDNYDAIVTSVLPGGIAAGWSDTRFGIELNAAIWDVAGSPSAPFGGTVGSGGGTSTSFFSTILGSNASGDFVGSREEGDGVLRGYIWRAGQPAPQLIDPPAGAFAAVARGVSNNANVVIEATVSGGNRGYFLDAAGNPAVDMGSLGGPGTQPLAVNDAGEAVGIAFATSSRRAGFYWTESDGIRAIPIGAPDTSNLTDINSRGDAVGSFRNFGSNERPILFNVRTQQVTFIDFLLSPSDREVWSLRSAVAINENGQVIGTGIRDGQSQVYVLQLPGYEPQNCSPADLAEPFGELNFFDVAAFIGLYNAGDPAADLAEPLGAINFFDVAEYIARFNAGCP